MLSHLFQFFTRVSIAGFPAKKFIIYYNYFLNFGKKYIKIRVSQTRNYFSKNYPDKTIFLHQEASELKMLCNTSFQCKFLADYKKKKKNAPEKIAVLPPPLPSIRRYLYEMLLIKIKIF